MRVLCFHADETPFPPNSYADSLQKAYPETTIITGSYQQITPVIAEASYDIVLLSCNDRSLLQIARIRHITLLIRASAPNSLILLHRFPSGPRSRLFSAIMFASYDFSFDNYLDASLLPLLASTLFFRRQHLLLHTKASAPLKGIVSMDQMSGEIIRQSLSRSGIHITLTEVSADFESQFRRLYPDFVVLHCHNRKGDTDIVKDATHMIRRVHPACIIYITCSIGIHPDFSQSYQLDEFLCDKLVSLPFIPRELLSMLMNDIARRYHLPPALP